MNKEPVQSLVIAVRAFLSQKVYNKETANRITVNFTLILLLPKIEM